MAKTTVTAVYAKPDSTPVEGKVEFLLVPANYQDFETALVTSPVVVPLAANGGLVVQLLPTSGADADWTDTDLLYEVTERVKGTPPNKYFVDVPTSTSSLRLGDLVGYAAPPPDPGLTAYPDAFYPDTVYPDQL